MNRFSRVLVIYSVLIVCACSSGYDAALLEKTYMDESSHFVEIDGNRGHYRDEGRGPVIVLIHGTASSLHTWDQWADDLKEKHRVIRMDLPGFGLTGPDHKDRYEVSDDVKFLAAFLKKLNIEQVHLVGSSLGGRIGWQYALEHRSQVRSLTLMNALGYPQEKWPPPIEMAQWPIVDTVMERFSPRFMYDIGLRDVYFDTDQVTDELVDRYFELSRYPGNLEAFPKRVKARLDKDSEQISLIKVPTLILWGEEDEFFPVDSAYRFKKDIAGAQLHVYPRVGHLPMEELPVISARHFKDFVDSELN